MITAYVRSGASWYFTKCDEIREQESCKKLCDGQLIWNAFFSILFLGNMKRLPSFYLQVSEILPMDGKDLPAKRKTRA